MSDPRLNKIRFRAWRRGFREADLILGPFADQQAAGLSAAELDEFERLLDQNDHDLYGWIIGRDEAPSDMQGLVLQKIQAFHLTLGQGEARGA